MGWRRYWEGETPVYVNERHKVAHYRLIADDLRVLIRRPDAHVLDYGSGEALFADSVAARCGKLYLLDGASRVRAALARRHAHARNIAVLAPENAGRIPDGSLDLVVVNSLLQYLGPAERDAVLATIRSKLRETGELIVADVIPRHVGPIQDASALLSFAARSGFLAGAATGLVRTYFSSYRTARAAFGLARYDIDEMLAVLARAGFDAVPAGRNLGHNPHRRAFVARPAPELARLPARVLAAAE